MMYQFFDACLKDRTMLQSSKTSKKERFFVNGSGLKKANLEKGQIASFLFDVQSDKNPFFEVFKVPKTKGITLDKFDEIIDLFQFCVGIG